MSEAKDKVVVITGASAGIGRATARLFARKGAKLCLIARGEKGLQAAKKEAQKYGVTCITVQADVADHEAVEKAADQAEAELGPIDIWINDAMSTVFGKFIDIDPKDYKRVTDVTYHGYVNGTRAALKHMIPRNRGKIVHVGSAMAYRGIPLQAPYSAAKHAIQGFNDSLVSELLNDNINIDVTMVQMPAFNTPQFSWGRNLTGKKSMPVPPIYQPEVAAQAIYYASFHKRREMYVSFNNLIIILGNKLFPGLGDRYLAKTGVSSQKTDEDLPKDRPDNLYEPVEGDFGARGHFDDMAKESSPQLWLDMNRGKIGFVSAALTVLAVYVILFILDGF